MGYMKLADIKIKDSFANTIPKEEKINGCGDYWENNHAQDRYIVVDHNNVLIDGYIQYLVLKENGIDVAEIKVSDREQQHIKKDDKLKQKIKSKRLSYREHETTYIYGIHPNSKSAKERVWRVPNSWWSGWADILNIGDMLLVHTNHGLETIEITKIERTIHCPVDIPVRAVVKKINKVY